MFFLALLIVSFPAALAAHFLHWPDAVTFVLCCAAVLPLAHYIGQATEALAHRVGAGLGGLLNATFGNAAELILAFAALRAGKLQVVKSSITGSILGNLLLIMGLAMLLGGLKRERQTFNPSAARAGVSTLFLAVAALIVPDLYAGEKVGALSVVLSVIMLGIYALSLWFGLRTHAHYYTDEPEVVEGHAWPVPRASAVLVLATAGTAVVAEFLIHAVEGAAVKLGLTETFVGLVVIAVVGNAAEHASAVVMAMKGRMNLAFNIAAESSKQIALFVAPVLVLASHWMGQPLDLVFTHLEVAGLAVGTLGLSLIASDGESNWLEGALLLGIYAVLATAFYFTGP